jgi:hypothetical protein
VRKSIAFVNGPRQPAVPHTPYQQLEPVLPEQRLSLEYEQGHTRVTRFLLHFLIFLYQRVIPLGLHLNGALERLRVEPGAGYGIRDVCP